MWRIIGVMAFTKFSGSVMEIVDSGLENALIKQFIVIDYWLASYIYACIIAPETISCKSQLQKLNKRLSKELCLQRCTRTLHSFKLGIFVYVTCLSQLTVTTVDCVVIACFIPLTILQIHERKVSGYTVHVFLGDSSFCTFENT